MSCEYSLEKGGVVKRLKAIAALKVIGSVLFVTACGGGGGG